MLSQQKTQNFMHGIIRDIERRGESLKQQLRDVSKQAQRTMDSHINCLKFEATYAFKVTKKQRTKTMEEIKEVRKELWEQSLKKAGGDIKKAYVFYDELCSFP